MKDQGYHLGRRAVLCGLVTWPVAGWAHDGHGSGFVVVDAETGWVRGNRIKLVLTVFNSGRDPAKLEAVQAEGAARVPVEDGLVAPGGLREFVVVLAFDREVPGLFTVVLDFGPDGKTAVPAMR